MYPNKLFLQPVPVVTRENPRITVTMQWAEQPEGEISLWMRRVGDPVEFAYYPALQVWGNQVMFQFDELLFVKQPGRYLGRLLLAGNHIADIEVQYEATTKVVDVESYNV